MVLNHDIKIKMKTKFTLCGYVTVIIFIKRFYRIARYLPLYCSVFTKWHVVFELIIFSEYSCLNYYWENLFLKSAVSVPHLVFVFRIIKITLKALKLMVKCIEWNVLLYFVEGCLWFLPWFVVPYSSHCYLTPLHLLRIIQKKKCYVCYWFTHYLLNLFLLASNIANSYRIISVA
jgi:hypothetical protein